jgi:hypothetical protein
VPKLVAGLLNPSWTSYRLQLVVPSSVQKTQRCGGDLRGHSLCRPRSAEAQSHLQSLIDNTKKAQFEKAEREEIASQINFLENKSMHQTGKRLAPKLLEQRYDGLEADAFFSKVYKMRNQIVHEGKIDPIAIHSVVGELDRFVSNIIRRHCIKA